jgi:hypothetical protein
VNKQHHCLIAALSSSGNQFPDTIQLSPLTQQTLIIDFNESQRDGTIVDVFAIQFQAGITGFVSYGACGNQIGAMRRIAGASPQQSHHGDDRKDGMARCEGHGFRVSHLGLTS